MNTAQLSYSSVGTFLDCKRKYWFRYVRNIVPIKFNKAYLIGEVVHYGIFQLYAKNQNAIEDTMQYFNDRVQELRNSLNISPDIEQDLVEQEYVIRGIIGAYAVRYEDIIAATIHHENEYKLNFKVSHNIEIVASLDNILDSGDGKLVHEIKTTKSLTPDYVKNIQNSFQACMYVHGYNQEHTNDPLIGIMYDVIKKPSIRLKKNESYNTYLNRLLEYYEDPANPDVFYMEIIKIPLLGKKRIYETVEGVGNEILDNGEDKSKFYCNDKFCYVYSRCEYFDVCHYGENPNTLMNFKDREVGDFSTNIIKILL